MRNQGNISSVGLDDVIWQGLERNKNNTAQRCCLKGEQGPGALPSLQLAGLHVQGGPVGWPVFTSSMWPGKVSSSRGSRERERLGSQGLGLSSRSATHWLGDLGHFSDPTGRGEMTGGAQGGTTGMRKSHSSPPPPPPEIPGSLTGCSVAKPCLGRWREVVTGPPHTAAQLAWFSKHNSTAPPHCAASPQVA